MAPAEPNAIPFHQKGDAPIFPEERDGWKGYVEWEKYPEKRKEAEAILAGYDFPDVCACNGSCHNFPFINWNYVSTDYEN